MISSHVALKNLRLEVINEFSRSCLQKYPLNKKLRVQTSIINFSAENNESIVKHSSTHSLHLI